MGISWMHLSYPQKLCLCNSAQLRTLYFGCLCTATVITIANLIFSEYSV